MGWTLDVLRSRPVAEVPRAILAFAALLASAVSYASGVEYQARSTGFISAPRWWVLAYGDSKSTYTYYPEDLVAKYASDTDRGPLTVTVLKVDGSTVTSRATTVAAELSALSLPYPPSVAPRAVLFQLGVVDARTVVAGDEAAWKAALGTILDAFHSKWPTALVYVAKPWGRDEAAGCDILAPWIDSVVDARDWADDGPDERIYLEGGDDGATMTFDGVHPTDAGSLGGADQWFTTINSNGW